MLEDVELLEAAVEIVSDIVPAVAIPVDIFVSPEVGEVAGCTSVNAHMKLFVYQ